MKYLFPLAQADDPVSAGRKAFNLARLARAGFKVPGGFVVAAGAPPESIGAGLGAAFAALGAPLAAVRSSAAAEDGEKNSFAGQFDSFLGVNAAGLERAVLACLASGSNARAAAYGGAPQALAVIVQEMVAPESSGVAFSCDPVTGDRSAAVIEAVYGLCEPLVSGSVTPDHYRFDKARLEETEVRIVTQPEYLGAGPGGGTALFPVPAEARAQRKLSAEMLRQVALAAMRVESLFEKPVDIEWAVKAGELYLLQARPVTGL
ncbi:MAG TPA: PEP/pyruvate-binding domain-containing protein [Elusimicrobiales bacterium]|nr:PEP/pyruvate-binding domain-containing protein [Elusimicrobiales bacterium]